MTRHKFSITLHSPITSVFDRRKMSATACANILLSGSLTFSHKTFNIPLETEMSNAPCIDRPKEGHVRRSKRQEQYRNSAKSRQGIRRGRQARKTASASS